jgi:CHAD domain-containing protein
LQAWALGPAPEGKTLQQIAPKALAKAHDALFRTAQFFAALTSEQRHRVRILAKRLRYSLDVLSVALPPKPTERYIAALSDLQDVLGELNDIAEARSALGRLTDSRSWRAYADTWLAQRAEQRIQASEARLLALLRTPPPWER